MDKDIKEQLIKKRQEIDEIRSQVGMWWHPNKRPEDFIGQVVGEIKAILHAHFGPESWQFSTFNEAKDTREAEGILNVIIDKLEDSDRAEGEGNIKAELEQFRNRLTRFKELLAAKSRGKQIDSREFEKIKSELPEIYGHLKPVIQKAAGDTTVTLMGGEYKEDVFKCVFSYTSFDPDALNVVMDTAIALVRTTIGALEKEVIPKASIEERTSPVYWAKRFWHLKRISSVRIWAKRFWWLIVAIGVIIGIIAGVITICG